MFRTKTSFSNLKYEDYAPCRMVPLVCPTKKSFPVFQMLFLRKWVSWEKVLGNYCKYTYIIANEREKMWLTQSSLYRDVTFFNNIPKLTLNNHHKHLFLYSFTRFILCTTVFSFLFANSIMYIPEKSN